MEKFYTFTMGGCVKELSDFVFEIGVSCLPPQQRAAGENVRGPDFLQTKAYRSKTKTYLNKFF
jgi:hypothetical protein